MSGVARCAMRRVARGLLAPGLIAAACGGEGAGAAPGPPTLPLPVAALPAVGTSGAPRIGAVQGSGQRSPFEGRSVSGVRGVVTAVHRTGFTLQSEDGDADDDPATSEGLLVHTGSAPAVAVGDAVSVSGTVVEYRPANRAAQLTVTEIGGEPRIEVLAQGRPLPAPVRLGEAAAGRRPPDRVIAPDALDFYEALEGMRVELRDARVIAPVSDHGELWVVADDGARASGLNAFGGLSRTPGDDNPERLLLDGSLVRLPRADTGARLAEPVLGVLGYAFGNYRLIVQSPLTASGGAAPPAPVAPARDDELLVASFNVENLSARSSRARFAALARQIVSALGAPDLLGLQELQDDSGPADDGTTSSAATAAQLCAAIREAGGPDYSHADIAPRDGEDGGQPGANIRPALLWRTDRGLELVARGAEGAHPEAFRAVRLVAVADRAGAGAARVQCTPSPGLLAPEDPAFTDSRKPLAAEFRWRGRPLFVVVNHWSSKGGDDPLFGERQPPRRGSELQRVRQAAVVRAFAAELLAADADADVIVLGDLNDFLDSAALEELTAGGLLIDLAASLPPVERWSYVYEGNSQQLDHLLVSPHLLAGSSVDGPPEFRFVHLNAGFREQASDHDPCVARLRPGASAER